MTRKPKATPVTLTGGAVKFSAKLVFADGCYIPCEVLCKIIPNPDAEIFDPPKSAKKKAAAAKKKGGKKL